ncbi:MAG: adenylate/guanylate cyclase domain-containing protein [Magnetococcales bacterium]|nr:adenylate/guanylate cyclase domain-containing protein [Magnetococcales bacterium]
MNSVVTAGIDLESRLRGTARGAVLQELFTNAIHFPIANIFLEMLLKPDVLDYLTEPDILILLFSSLAQAWYLGMGRYRGHWRPLAGNLIGPALYTLSELLRDGIEILHVPNYIAYWAFSAVIGLLQEGRRLGPVSLQGGFLLLEHLARTGIVVVCYAIFENLQKGKVVSFEGFFLEVSHVYVTAIIMLLGLVVGFSNLVAQRFLRILQETAGELRIYASWFLGPRLLKEAVDGMEERLALKRQWRGVMFMDVRGFTRWSESHSPVEVVKLLNDYFDVVEKAMSGADVIKVKHTADEIMGVFPDGEEALRVAKSLRPVVSDFLKGYGLSAGVGVHEGELVEGLIGSSGVKLYDVIGDTVNTGKRICDNTPGGEVWVSERVWQRVHPGRWHFGEPVDVAAKGKSQPLRVYPLTFNM